MSYFAINDNTMWYYSVTPPRKSQKDILMNVTFSLAPVFKVKIDLWQMNVSIFYF